MISILVTAFKEQKTIGRAIESILNQKVNNSEILVSAPDDETITEAKKYSKNKVQVFKDSGEGKPNALNMLVKKSRGDLLVLTDGDVFTDSNSINNLLRHFKDKKVGSVSSRVVSINGRKNMFGFWSEILTSINHIQRLRHKGDTICSGYLYAVRRELFPNLPKNTLAEDALASLNVIDKGYKSVYEPSSLVFVKYPTNLPDWISQKKRTAGRVYQMSSKSNTNKLRRLKEEVSAGIFSLREVESVHEFIWLISLFVMRSYIWVRILLDFRLWNRNYRKVWERVESTK